MIQNITQRIFLLFRCAAQNGQIFLFERAGLQLLRQGCGSKLRFCIDHHAADNLVEPVHRKDLRAAKLRGQLLRHRVWRFALCGRTNRFDTDGKLRVLINDLKHVPAHPSARIIPCPGMQRNRSCLHFLHKNGIIEPNY